MAMLEGGRVILSMVSRREGKSCASMRGISTTQPDFSGFGDLCFIERRDAFRVILLMQLNRESPPGLNSKEAPEVDGWEGYDTGMKVLLEAICSSGGIIV